MDEPTTQDAAVPQGSDARYRAVVQSALDAIIVIDSRGHIMEFNPAAERVFGWSRAQAMGLDVADVIVPPELREGHRSGLQRHLQTGVSTLLDRRLELIAVRAGGERFPIELTVTRSDGGAKPYFTAFIRDLSEQQRLKEAVAHLASHDIVTGLDRYPKLEPRLIAAMDGGEAFVAVIFIDLDRFHGINESIGHGCGDAVLNAVGERLQALAGERIAVCHFASDEFVVVQEGGDAGSAAQLAESIRNLLALPFEAAGYRVLLTTTIGVACAPAHGCVALDLLRRAQAAVERGKALGRDSVSVFQIEDMQDIEDRIAMGGLLRAAVQAGELTLHYQPQFAALDMRLTGFESLLRWSNPVLGQVPPGRFIPIAEALGMMPEIGNWVLHEACRQARVWLDAGHSRFTIAVNISPQQLRRPGLHRTVDEALRKFGVPGNTLEIELTESTALENVARVRHELDQLKALGVVLTLDDFGTGHSSLAYLKQFAMDKLKIDQTFVQGLPDNPLDASISRGILAMGRDLGLRVAAEGVETTQQAAFLRDLGCDELQGYLMGKPAPAAAAAGYFDALDAGGNGRPAAVAAPSPGSG